MVFVIIYIRKFRKKIYNLNILNNLINMENTSNELNTPTVEKKESRRDSKFVDTELKKINLASMHLTSQ